MTQNETPKSKCRACGADMIWAVTANGKSMPLDASPQKMFVVDGKYCRAVDAYTPHWATCPKADMFRKGK